MKTETGERIVAMASPALLFIMLTVLLVGPHPLSGVGVDKLEVAQDGNLLNRVAMVAFLGLAVPLAATAPGTVWRILRRNWAVVALLVWFMASALWASHPELTVRRALAYWMFYVAAVAVAATMPSLQAFQKSLFACFALIAAANAGSVLLVPGLAINELGAIGISDNKNTAGSMALMSIVVLTFSLGVLRRAPSIALAALLLIASWWFLVQTNSKTSLGLAMLLTVALPGPLWALNRIESARLALPLMALLGLSLGVLYLGVLGIDFEDLQLLVFGDLTFTGRTFIWDALVREIADRPLLGYGFGSFWDIGQPLNPIKSASPYEFFLLANLINTAHSGYLDVLLQTGVVGLLLAVAALLRGLRLSVLLILPQKSLRDAFVVMGMVGLLVACALNNFLESILFRAGDAIGYLAVVVLLHAERWSLALEDRRVPVRVPAPEALWMPPPPHRTV
ncbi:O-antigen ligase family protein [Azospirillum soli]|uniref:O-antigen ligase family protein n=1 Tax=Azospirillum soli TaxID=1304799 RepID=UPI001AE14C7A|nr:O-antigen ligase family protein [Azospirillum soli]MBP2312545.1 O-antigen ligase [Azospirillum soli]